MSHETLEGYDKVMKSLDNEIFKKSIRHLVRSIRWNVAQNTKVLDTASHVFCTLLELAGSQKLTHYMSKP